MIKLCIFDLDGTVADTLEDLADSMNYALKCAGLPPHPKDSYRQFVGDRVMKLIERASGKSDEETQISIKSNFDLYYKTHSTSKTKAYPGCRELFEKLREYGIGCAIFSNKPHEFVDGILKTIYPGQKFLFAIGKRDSYPRKPCPDAMLDEISKLGIDSSQCLYIGDSNVDVLTAHNAGMLCCGVSWGFRGRQELENAKSDFVLDSPMEILKVCTGDESKAQI